VSRKRAMQLCANNESPLDVMFDNMLFWHRQSRDLGAKLDTICGKIKNEDDRREAISLVRTLLSARENAQWCAVDCAPYVHAKLQAVHHEHSPSGRYVISDRKRRSAAPLRCHTRWRPRRARSRARDKWRLRARSPWGARSPRRVRREKRKTLQEVRASRST
jgi:hypothetical protein